MVKVHPLSVVDPKAEIDDDVEIGPFCTVGPQVKIGSGTRLISHNVIDGDTILGKGNTLYPFASLGLPCQHKRNKATDLKLRIGDSNVFREHFTAHTGSDVDQKITIIGSRNWFLVASHVAHDCIVGDDVVMSNNASLAGHVVVGNHAIISGMSGVVQFAHIGEGAMVGAMVGVVKDVIPYGMVMRDGLAGLNLVGLQRAGVEKNLIAELQLAYKELFFGEGVLVDRIEKLEDKYSNHQLVSKVISFCRNISRNGLMQPEKKK